MSADVEAALTAAARMLDELAAATPRMTGRQRRQALIAVAAFMEDLRAAGVIR